MVAGLIIVPIVSLFTPKIQKQTVDSIFNAMKKPLLYVRKSIQE